jgi:hypothetical protein
VVPGSRASFARVRVCVGFARARVCVRASARQLTSHALKMSVLGERVLEVASKSEARARGCDRNGAGKRVAEEERARRADRPAKI